MWKENVVNTKSNYRRDWLVIPLVIAIVAVLIISGKALAATPQTQSERIQRDINIMENVLDQLIIHESPFLFESEGSLEGIYLEGFGIMFDMVSFGLTDIPGMIEYTLRNLPNISVIEQDGKRVRIDIDEDREADEDYRKRIDKKVNETRQLLHEFFRDYASATKSLPQDEMICANIRLRAEAPRILFGSTDQKIPTQFRICAKAEDLADYRRGKLNEEQFLAKLDETLQYGAESDRDLEIMENILDSGLKRFGEESFSYSDGQTRGMYLENFGVLFVSGVDLFDHYAGHFIRMKDDYERMARDMERALERGDLPEPPEPPEPPESEDEDDDERDRYRYHYSWSERRELSQARRDSLLNELEIELLQLIGQYGHTLNKLKDTEYIMITLDLDEKMYDKGVGKFNLKIKKSDVMKFNRDQIDLENLRKKAKIWCS